jgi:predicted Zn-dependent peptidase
LEDLAAAIEASAGQQSTTIDFQCMSRDAPEVLRLLAELVQQPALPDPQLKVIKDQVENIIGHRDDGASNVARRCGSVDAAVAEPSASAACCTMDILPVATGA